MKRLFIGVVVLALVAFLGTIIGGSLAAYGTDTSATVTNSTVLVAATDTDVGLPATGYAQTSSAIEAPLAAGESHLATVSTSSNQISQELASPDNADLPVAQASSTHGIAVLTFVTQERAVAVAFAILLLTTWIYGRVPSDPSVRKWRISKRATAPMFRMSTAN